MPNPADILSRSLEDFWKVFRGFLEGFEDFETRATNCLGFGLLRYN
jgi:hypothetical protein